MSKKATGIAAPVQLHVMPTTVYKADDGVHPEWRFALLAINRGKDNICLEQSEISLNTTKGRKRRVRTGDRIEGIVQGSRDIHPGGVTVLSVIDQAKSKGIPRSVSAKLRFVDKQGKEIIARKRVRLETRPTVYLRFPLEGRWRTVSARNDAHCLGMQFGFDFVAPQDADLHQDPPKRELGLEEFVSFGQPVLAPRNGIVVKCAGDEPDFPPTPGRPPFAAGPPKDRRERYLGNYILMTTEENDYVLMAHLKQGSLRVAPGSYVWEGRPIGQVGNSGNTTGPHLHIEMLDGLPDLSKIGTPQITQSGIPFGFRSILLEREDEETALTKGVPQRKDVVGSQTSG